MSKIENGIVEGVARTADQPTGQEETMVFDQSNQKTVSRLAWVAMLTVAVLVFGSCIAYAGGEQDSSLTDTGFPDFITSAEDYYVTRISYVPEIDGETFRLDIGGLVGASASLTLDELYGMADVELPLTVECIGNSRDGPLLSTAVWKGVLLYDLLQDLGIDEAATGVRYEAADGYYASHTLEQLRDNNVLLALYMNDDPIPPLHGFPIRVLNPGYYGVKQPAWVVAIEVIDRKLEDYWSDRGWDVSPPIAIDSKIFSPQGHRRVGLGEELRINGAAFGGRRVDRVELTTDGGETWSDATIVEQLDADNVWVFWETKISFAEPGSYVVNVRATDISGVSQQEDDPTKYDGTNDWPMVKVTVR
jgi:DMSO/TMAO reductase YedYZ molybdopterin-dependent catalytic subunit